MDAYDVLVLLAPEPLPDLLPSNEPTQQEWEQAEKRMRSVSDVLARQVVCT